MPERILVTSALPYANGPIHFGHAVGAYLPADIYTRFRRMLGDDVHYVCGSDEHGAPITLKAEQQGKSYNDYVDHWHGEIKATLDSLGIEFDIFSGTSHHRNPFHREMSQQFFLDLQANGYLTEKTEEQFYSVESDRFLPDRYVQGTCYLCGFEKARGDECPSCGKYLDAKLLKKPKSTLDGTEPVLRETKHWYLDLGKARDTWLEDWFESKSGQWKPNVENFVRSDLKDLRERPITRDLKWGVPVPVEGAEGKVLYVWFDAPIGYISISKQYWEQKGQPERFEEFWKGEDTKLYHFIGKDNITFHAVVFPTILKGADKGWILPENVPANEFFNLEGQKFNTSAGWYIPEDSIRGKYPTDALRYALCSMMPETADSDWTWSEFQSRLNNELADNLGNFVTRTMRFIERFFDGVVPATLELRDADQALLDAAKTHAVEMQQNLHEFKFRKACQTLMSLSNECNKYYDTQEPWKVQKQEGGKALAGHVMRICCEMIRSLAILATPIMPDTSKILLSSLGVSGAAAFDDVGTIALGDGAVADLPLTSSFPKFIDGKGQEKTALFRKVDDKVIAAELKKLEAMGEAKTDEKPSHEPIASEIEFDTFAATDIRAATVLEAEKHPKADRLLVLKVDLGFEQRTIVAGVAASYAPTDLPGKRVCVVANLAPRKLRGIASQGMILATDDADGKPRFVEPNGDTPNGTRVK